MYDLRPYQTTAVEQIRQTYRDGAKAPLLVLPTGGGKTVVFNYIAANSAARGKRVMILVHRIELIRQTSKKLLQGGFQHGIINSRFEPDYRQKIQVPSVQTLVSRLDKIPFEPDLIIIDEAHHANANSWVKILQRYPNAHRLGVTATPCRTDGSGLGLASGGFFDCMVQGPQIYELIDQGYLARPVVYAPSTVDLSGVHTTAGDYNKGELKRLMDKPTITGDAVEHYRKICPGEPTVVFCTSVEHAEHVAAQFRQAGFRFYAVDGSMDDEKREYLINNLGTPAVQGLTSCDLISEGTDIPAISCAIMLRPTQSLGLYLQQVGRALRVTPGKERAVILDHVGNVLRHGLPDEHREWSLDAERVKPPKEPTLKAMTCPRCYATHKPAARCPLCDWTYQNGRGLVKNPESGPKQVAGELRELTENDRNAMRRHRMYEQSKAQTLEDLQRLGQQRGYKPGWAHSIWRIRQEKQQKQAV